MLIRNATVFDGTGTPPRIEDVLLRDGRIAARGVGLAAPADARIIDAGQLWARSARSSRSSPRRGS